MSEFTAPPGEGEDGGAASPAGAGSSAGQLLRQMRQAAGMHIAALATTLKVPVERLEALEADRYEDFKDHVFMRALAELCQEEGLVLATGGGAVLREENRRALREGGCVIYLHASVEQQLERTSRDRNRPLLQTENPGDVLRKLFTLRDPLYRDVADLIIETDQRPPRMVMQEILDRLDQLPPR